MELGERVTQIEDRLAKIEELLKPDIVQPAAPTKPQPVSTPPAVGFKTKMAATIIPSASEIAADHKNLSPVTTILGWAGATALVMASIYLVVLAIDAGWLTPVRQLILAALGGFICIGAGLLLRGKDMHYASLLPAGGVVILFLSIYGAHNYYHLVSATFATSGIIIICLVSLWLNRLFLSELYALFAVIGSYTAPVLLGGDNYTITDLIVYFACWSILFSIFSVWTGKRSIYILAMYLALVVFDLKWSSSIPDAWVEALVFQTVHFLIFVAAASMFSIRIAPMSQESAFKHIPALVLFYFVQYHILAKHIPEFAPWIAIASAAVLLVSYFAVHRVLGQVLESGRTLLSFYVALVLVHAGYIESVPAQWTPWVGLAVIPAVGAYAALRRNAKAPGTPLWVAAVLIFIVNYIGLFAGDSIQLAQMVPAHDLLVFFYAAELYFIYYFSRKTTEIKEVGMMSLYAGHVAIMFWAMQVFDSRFIVSLIWGALALGCLFLSLQKRNKILGQSSLLIFSASVLKVLLYDIALAAPLIRIGSLLVLGVSLYLGGWLYKKVNNLETD